MKTYTVAIIGCGSIGALKDSAYDSPDTDAVLTHANAFSRHPGTELAGVIDSSVIKALDAGEKWGVTPYPSIGNFRMYNGAPDIVVVATPTETHHDILMEVIKHHEPKLVVAEKPFCQTLAEAQEVHDAYRAAGIPILVNYTRRFDAVSAQIFDDLRDGKFGDIYHARCLYGRGLRRDGCHGLDIFNWVFGDAHGLFFSHQAIVDHLSFDPSYTLRLEYEKCGEVYMIGTDSRRWGAFELDFITAAGVLRFSNWGRVFQHFKPEREQQYGQYQALSSCAQKKRTGLPTAMLNMTDYAVAHLRGNEALPCTSKEALAVHEILGGVGEGK